MFSKHLSDVLKHLEHVLSGLKHLEDVKWSKTTCDVLKHFQMFTAKFLDVLCFQNIFENLKHLTRHDNLKYLTSQTSSSSDFY